MTARWPSVRGRSPTDWPADGVGRSTGLAWSDELSDDAAATEPLLLSDRTGHRRDRGQRQTVYAAAFMLVLLLGAALRLWQVGAKPGWQSDEPVYTSIANNILLHGTLNDHIQYGQTWSPFLFHPPFYMLLLAGWFKLFGVGIPQARVLSAIASVIMLGLLGRLIWKLHGPVIAVAAMTLVIFDGWLLFIQRVSYIENTLMLLIVAGLLAYDRALRAPSARRFITAGLVIGLAVIFKLTAGYVLAAVALHFLIVRRERKNHLLLAGAVATVLAVYLAGMTWFFNVNNHNWFYQQSLIQVERVLGLRHSRGTLGSPLKFLHLLGHQYALFIPSLVVAIASFVLLALRAVQCVRARSWQPVRPNSLLFSWSVAGIIVFGASQLRFPQYFALVLIPMYCFVWTELFRHLNARSAKRVVVALASAVAVIAVANVGSFYLRVLDRHDNVLLEVKQYAEKHIPLTTPVITEEEIADEIPQPWCSVARAGACRVSAPYAITYQTYLQPVAPPNDRAFAQIIKGAVKVKVFVGFKETITVWKLR